MKKHAKKLVVVLLAVAMLVPTIAMIMSSAAQTYTVELAYDNIFAFEKWASNSLSSTALLDGTPLSGNNASEGGTITKDVQNGKFTMTKTDMTKLELFTAFSTDAVNATANEDYYMMKVNPNTSYTFTYNVDGDIWVFTPYVFMYTKEGLYDSLVAYPTPGYGINSFNFTTPSNVAYIQIRFTIGDTSSNHAGVSSVTANVSDIAIYKTELLKSYLESKNLFSFEGWAGNTYSSSPIDSTTGTVNTDVNFETITFTTAASAGATLFTGNGVLTGNPSSYYYSVDVDPNTTYTLTYSISDSTLPGPVHCQPYIVEYNASGDNVSLFNIETPQEIGNKKTFTTTGTTDKLQLVFAIINNDQAVSRTCKVYDIGIYEDEVLTADFETITGHPARQTFTYESNSGDTYGTLPTPSNVPEGMVFAGWYTGENGAGERIHSGSEISYESKTVYSKFEPAVDSLTVKNNPTKRTYTVGEKFNPEGLILTYSVDTEVITRDENGNIIETKTVTTTNDISSGYYCTPEYLTSVGTQTITAHYGGKTATFTVDVADGNNETVVINGTNQTVKVANNKYTLNYSASAFNRYEISYYSDSYVKGIITFNNNKTEEIFLEPSNSGSFDSYVDGFLNSSTYTSVVSMEFTCLNKEFGKFELYSLNTVNASVPNNTTQYFENEKYKVGINLAFGGVISYIECLEGSTDSNDNVIAAQYTDSNGKVYTKVDYKDKLPSGAIATVESVNLINTNDRGRYLQQSYYGTSEPPFVKGDYNGVEWNYNPVQGGNLNIYDPATGEVIRGGESSKVIDYRITENQIYVKTRPLDWGKNSVDYADDPAWNTPSYMEAWYTFTTDGKGLIQGTCRFVDYSGYPANTTTQEFPALYTIEPLNHFVYNDVAEGDAWDASQTEFRNDSYNDATGAKNIEEPDFWGVLPSYNQYNPDGPVDPNIDAYENWAAFTASEDKDSFGIGIYSPGISNIHYGCFVSKYEENQYKAKGEQGATEDGGYIKALKAGTQNSYKHVENYRHADTLNPSIEGHTSYIAPIETLTFQSYTPITYTYYVSTGTADEIREDFRMAKENDEKADKEATKIAVPETVYMTPIAADATHTKVGQYYVNNIINNFNVIETIAESNDNMYVGLYALDAKEFTVKVTNATNSSDDIELYNLSTGAVVEGQKIAYPADGTYRADNTYGLRFKNTGLEYGGIATAKWEITVTLEDNTTKTYTAYTVLYAPERTIGAVAEARRSSNDNNETGTWITGATSMVTDADGNHILTPIGGYTKGDPIKSGYFKQDPLVYPEKMTTTATPKTADDHINITTDATAYVMQTAVQSNDHSRARSYLGLLTIDQSRYSNTNQIPNLQIGYDVLLVTKGRNDSLKDYKTAYTIGTETAFAPSGSGDSNIQAFPSNWTTTGLIGDGRIQDWNNTSYATPFRQTVVPDFAISSSMDGQYIHTVSQGLANYLGDRTYGTSVASVKISITDKSELRDAVLDGYNVIDGTPLFNEKLQDAATVLGDPTSTQEEIDNAVRELSDSFTYALKYDNLFSALEMSQHSNSMETSHANASATYYDGTITVSNTALGNSGEAYTKYSSGSGYYHVALQPNTEYVFEYDVTTDAKAQAFMFFYNASGSNSEKPENMSIKVNDGSWAGKSESNSWWGNYTNSAGTYSYAIKFTTGSTTTMASFRFGNTTSAACTSIFSNIKLIDSAHYYEEATYSKTEEAFQQNTAYGVLITPARPGYTFAGWKDAEGNTVTGADVAKNHLTVYSVWTANTYTITYNANGGSVSHASQTYKPDETATLTTASRNGYLFQNWTVTASDGSWKVGDTYQAFENVSGLYGNVTLTAQWGANEIPVYFDTILDFDKWNKTSAGNATISNVTSNGFTLTSNAGADEGTSSSPYFDVVPGKSYKIDMEITGDNWDVYVFFCDSNGSWIDFSDSTNRYASNGHGPADRVFTAPNKPEVVKAQIRVDANGSSNAVTFSDIRVYEAGTRAANVNVPDSSRVVQFGQSIGTLPVPTREGYTFTGWFDENGNKVVDNQNVKYTSAVYLKSTWTVSNDALVEDNVVIDFGTPVSINPFANDKLNGLTFLGISLDGTNPSKSELNSTYGKFTVSGNTVTYKPTKALNGVDTIYYHASVTDENGTATHIKNEINVVPASNVLYEETFFTDKDSTGLEWIAPSDAKALNTTQTLNPAKEVYGYEKNYDSYAKYSDGTALQVNVTETNKRSMIKAFDFAGSGFDLNGVCGKDTGVLIVSLMDTAANNGNGKMVKSYVIDTYYNDVDGDGVDLYADKLYQVPILHEDAIGYGNYKVQIVASWLPSMSSAIKAAQKAEVQSVEGFDDMTFSTATVEDDAELREALAEIGMEDILNAEEVEVIWFDDNSVLNGGTGANAPAEGMMETAGLENFALVNIIDSVRVYNPLDDNDQYYIGTEKGAQYFNVMGNLVNVDEVNGNPIFGEGSYFAYITGKSAGDFTIDHYKEFGPKDELYLTSTVAGENAITFSIKNAAGANVMISLRAASGTPKAKFYKEDIIVNSNTEMYYDITKNIVLDEDGNATVTIQNIAPGSLLSIGSVKITSGVMETASLSTDIDLMTVRTMMMAPSVTVEPNMPDIELEDPTDEPTDDPTDEPTDEPTDDPTDEPTDDPVDDNDEAGCWLVRLFKWLVEKFTIIFNAVKSILGF